MQKEFQLVGIVCLFLASKFEEIYYPKMKQFVYICDNAYSREEILLKEQEVLEVLEYNIGSVTIAEQITTLQHMFGFNSKMTEKATIYSFLYLLEND